MPSIDKFDERRVGDYDLVGRLGKGSFGKVYKAIHAQTKKEVALKAIHREKVVKKGVVVAREVATLRIARHPCVLSLLDVFPSRNNFCIVTELVKGGTLLEFLRNNRKPSPDLLFRIFYCITSGVEFCHACGLCHRDLKPENILMCNPTLPGADVEGQMDTRMGDCKIADFGLANFMNSDGSLLHTRCGSPHYAAPEVHKGTAGYNGAKADVWSLGVLLFAMHAKKLPFDDKNPALQIKKIMSGDFVMPTEFPTNLSSLIEAMLTPDPSKRLSVSEIKSHDYWRGNCLLLGFSASGFHQSPFMSPPTEVSGTPPRRGSLPPCEPLPHPNMGAETPYRVAKALPAPRSTGLDPSRLQEAIPEDEIEEGILSLLLQLEPSIGRAKMMSLLTSTEHSMAKALHHLMVHTSGDLEIILSMMNVFCPRTITANTWREVLETDTRKAVSFSKEIARASGQDLQRRRSFIDKLFRRNSWVEDRNRPSALPELRRQSAPCIVPCQPPHTEN